MPTRNALAYWTIRKLRRKYCVVNTALGLQRLTVRLNKKHCLYHLCYNCFGQRCIFLRLIKGVKYSDIKRSKTIFRKGSLAEREGEVQLSPFVHWKYHLPFYKTSILNEDVNCNESPSSVSIPRFRYKTKWNKTLDKKWWLSVKIAT
jgi:hypothetical protein